MRFFRTFSVQELKLSITGDTAKILVLNSREVVHFHLKTHPTQEKDETRFLGREIHPYTPDPFPLYFATSACLDNRMNPHNLLHLGRAHNAIRLHGKPTKTVKTYQFSLFLGGNPQVHPQAMTTMCTVPKCTVNHHKCTWP